MENTAQIRPSCWPHHEKFIQPLGEEIILMRLPQFTGENQILIRFNNGYGVIILPVTGDGAGEIWQMIVIRFQGTGTDDYRVAQYAPIDEFHHGSLEEIIDLCREVAALPTNLAKLTAAAAVDAEVRERDWEQQCSNF